MPKEKAIAALRQVITELNACASASSTEDQRFKAWYEAAQSTFRYVFGEESAEFVALVRINFSSPHFEPESFAGDAFGDYEIRRAPLSDRSFFQSGVQEARALVEVYIAQIERFWPDEPSQKVAQRSPVDLVVQICERFPIAARRLRNRRESRPPLLMSDEYDVQYLLGAILDIHFDDIVPEGWVPEYGGGASRIDFVLRPERVAIETKRTRPSLTTKEVGEQLIIDIARYNERSGVDSLICFIHDPEHLISNPRGLERDLENLPSGRLKVRVLVRPQ